MVILSIKTTVKNNADAEDILQQTFLSAWRKLSTLSDPSAFNTWIQRIALNECYSLLRKKNISILLDSEQEPQTIDMETSDELIPAVYAERKDLRLRLEKILADLSEVQRQSMILFYFDELKVEEIAEIMDCSPNTVKTRLFLARKAIRSEIEEQERKSGQKFYGVAGIPMLALSQLLVQQAEAASLAPAAASNILQSISSAIAAEAAAAAKAAAAASAGSAAASPVGLAAGAKAGVSLMTKIIAGIAAAAVVATGGIVLWLSGHETLSAEDKAYLTEVSAALLDFLAVYENGTYDGDTAGALKQVQHGIFALQDTDRFRSIVDKLSDENGGGETLRSAF